MEKYVKNIDGRTVVKTKNKIIVVKDGMQTINPTHEMLIADGWEVFAVPEMTEAEKLESARRDLLRDIENYDKGIGVNSFYIGGDMLWLDKVTRSGLMLRLQAEKAAGKDTTTLWYDGRMYSIPIETAVNMLYALEVYASACYDNTQRHLSAVNGLRTLEDIENYNYRSGYPEHLFF